MGRLRRVDLELVLDVARELERIPDLDVFPEGALAALGRLVPCDWSSWVEVDRPGDAPRETVRAAAGVGLPRGFPGAERSRWLREGPLVAEARRRGDGRVVGLSQLLSRADRRALELYRSSLEPLGVRDELLVPVETGPGGLTAIVLDRSAAPFARRERDLLDLVRERLAAAHRSLAARARLGAALRALEDALSARGEGVAVLGEGERIALATPRASEWLVELYGGGDADELPGELARWVSAARADAAEEPPGRGVADELLLERGDGTCVAVRFVARGPEAGGDLLLFAERQRVLSSESFAPLGLRRREAEVLALVARGLSDGEIASTLVVSRRTVEKHLEHIYQSLGVRGRTAAVAFALAAMGLPL